MKKTCGLFCLATALAAGVLVAWAETPELPLQPIAVIEGFDVPECAVVDPDTGFIYVSNIEAVPDEYWSDNGKGSISRLNPDGTVDSLRWAESTSEFLIHSPKGMCILDGKLYVADNSRVLIFTLADGKSERAIPVPDTERLNDMATDGKDIYVSEVAAGLILRLDLSDEGQHHTVARLESVNGITFDNGQMFAVSWELHELYEIDRTGAKPPQPFGLADHFTNLDGIEVLENGTFLVSDFMGNKVALVSEDRKSVTTIAELETPADIGLNREKGLLYVPQLTKDTVVIYQLP